MLATLFAVIGCTHHTAARSKAFPPGFSVGSSTNGNRYELIIILTNSEPPVMRSAIAVIKKGQYYQIGVGAHGEQQPTVAGTMPPEVYKGVLRESELLPANLTPDGCPVWYTREDGQHPVNIQRLLDLAATNRRTNGLSP